MGKKPTTPSYWPLGAIDYSVEIIEEYPDEAQLLGAITILWNRQEIALRRLFVALLATRREGFAEAIWDRQPTHKARRDLLELAMLTVKLTRRQKGILGWVIDNSKKLADRRNDLIHAEYVVEHYTAKLHAKIKSPGSRKPAKHQKAMASELRALLRELDNLVAASEVAWLDFAPAYVRRMMRQLRQIRESV